MSAAMWILLLWACTSAPVDGPVVPFTDTGTVAGSAAGVADTAVPLACGDGVLDPDEECDDGTANADTPNACRTNCRLPRCGDGISDAGERCDDGNQVGGDGCLPGCATEEGPFEAEPNDEPATATAADGALAGHLTAGDVDCAAVDVPAGGWLEATVHTAGCAWATRLALRAPDGDELALAWPSVDTGCPAVLPEDGARYLPAGTYALCVDALFGAEVPAYRLEWTVGDDSCAIPGLEPGPDEDFDGDGLADDCDEDDDGDGAPDVDDTCPWLADNGDGWFAPNDDGYLGAWLVLGPLDGDAASCAPPEESVLGDVGLAIPWLGDAVAEHAWHALVTDADELDFDAIWPDARSPREVVLVTYLHSERARDVDLALGPDDGVHAYWNGERVIDEDGCQGASPDRFTTPVSLRAGWTRLTVRVHDTGGGWGLYPRLLDDGDPVTDLRIALAPDGSPIPAQADSDGDGLGDLCDPTPL